MIADAQTRDIQCLLSGLLMIVSTIANPVAAFLSQHLLMPWIAQTQLPSQSECACTCLDIWRDGLPSDDAQLELSPE